MQKARAGDSLLGASGGQRGEAAVGARRSGRPRNQTKKAQIAAAENKLKKKSAKVAVEASGSDVHEEITKLSATR